MKTLNGWKKQGGDFGKYVNPKDEINDEIYFYFLEVVPPRIMRDYGFLVGTAAFHNNNGEAVYDSFYNNGEQYFYGGLKTVKEFTDSNRDKENLREAHLRGADIGENLRKKNIK